MPQFEFPLQFKKQYAAPLDVDVVFDTTSARISFLTSPIRYAGQIVSDLQTQKCYQLSTNTNSWIEIGGDSLSLLNSLSSNWNSVYTSVSSVSSSWNSVYNNVNSLSSNWQTAYAYVSANSVNLTASNVFVNNNLTVTNTVSAKYFKGTIIDWMTLTRGFKTEPTLNSTIAGGDVYNYVYESSPTDKTYYRYIATDGSEDSYYETFSGGNLSNLIAKKKITV
jgi:hypothetical protein